MKNAFLAVVVFILAAPTQAHMLWLERNKPEMTRAFFGEYSDNVKETQSGSLKEFNQAQALQADSKIKALIHPEYLSYATKGQADVMVNHAFFYEESLLQYSAKTGRQSNTVRAELEIVSSKPTGKDFMVYFQNKPLVEQQVVLFSPQGWEKKYTTNAQGLIRIDMPWKGQYILEVNKEVDEAGEYNNKPFKKRYLNSSLSFSY